MKLAAQISIVFVVILFIILLAGYGYISIPVAHIFFSKDRYCKLEFHQWTTGRCVLSYYEDGVCAGTVRLHSDLLNNPIGVFPGADGKSVLCISDLDTTKAAFTVDFTERNSNGVAIPERLREPGQEAVDFSNFKVRACTTEEVEFVKQYIRMADLGTLSNLVKWGATPETRANMLAFLVYATTPNDWKNPVLKYAKPQILPEDNGSTNADEKPTPR